MNPRHAILIACLFCVSCASSAGAQTGGAYDLRWNVLAGGGQTFAAGGAYRLGATGGQAAASSLAGGVYDLKAGFWLTTAPPPVGVAPSGDPLPVAFAARSGGPNPFKGSTSLRFDLPEARPVSIVIHGVDGRLVRRLVDRPFGAGRHSAWWDGLDQAGRVVSPGIYFARVVAGSAQATLRLVRLY